MDHCAVGNVETFANLLEKETLISVLFLEHVL